MTHTEIFFLQVSVFNQVSTFLLSAIKDVPWFKLLSDGYKQQFTSLEHKRKSLRLNKLYRRSSKRHQVMLSYASKVHGSSSKSLNVRQTGKPVMLDKLLRKQLMMSRLLNSRGRVNCKLHVENWKQLV